MRLVPLIMTGGIHDINGEDGMILAFLFEVLKVTPDNEVLDCRF